MIKDAVRRIALVCLAWAVMSGVAFAANPADLIGTPMTLPAPWWLFKVLLMLTFFIHLVLINIVLGSVLVAVISNRSPMQDATELGRGLSFGPKTFALAVNFGVAPYLFIQVLYSSVLYPSIVIMAVWWVCIAVFAMLGYYGLYVVCDDKKAGLFWKRVVLTLTALLLLTVAFLFVSANTLMLRPDRWVAWYENPHGTFLNVGDPTFLPRYLHVVVGSLSIGGLVLAWRGRLGRRFSGAAAQLSEQRTRSGLSWFFYASLLQAMVGVFFLFMQPVAVRNMFLGQNPLATGLLLLAAGILVFSLAMARQGRLKPVTGAALVIVMLMVCIRDIVRDAQLTPHTQGMLGEGLFMFKGQSAALALFLVCACLAAIVIVYLARLAIKLFARPNASGSVEG